MTLLRILCKTLNALTEITWDVLKKISYFPTRIIVCIVINKVDILTIYVEIRTDLVGKGQSISWPQCMILWRSCWYIPPGSKRFCHWEQGREAHGYHGLPPSGLHLMSLSPPIRDRAWWPLTNGKPASHPQPLPMATAWCTSVLSPPWSRRHQPLPASDWSPGPSAGIWLVHY